MILPTFYDLTDVITIAPESVIFHQQWLIGDFPGPPEVAAVVNFIASQPCESSETQGVNSSLSRSD